MLKRIYKEGLRVKYYPIKESSVLNYYQNLRNERGILKDGKKG